MNIARGTGKDAPGGVFDGSRRDVPGPASTGRTMAPRDEGEAGGSPRPRGSRSATGHDAPRRRRGLAGGRAGSGRVPRGRRKPARSAVNIGKASGKDAPGGVFDAAVRSGGGPGPGEFESAPGAPATGRRG